MFDNFTRNLMFKDVKNRNTCIIEGQKRSSTSTYSSFILEPSFRVIRPVEAIRSLLKVENSKSLKNSIAVREITLYARVKYPEDDALPKSFAI